VFHSSVHAVVSTVEPSKLAQGVVAGSNLSRVTSYPTKISAWYSSASAGK